MTVPADLIAGDTWSWTRELGDYPATTHTAAWYFENKDAVFNVSATPDGTSFAGALAAATSALKVAGRYRWRLVVTRTSDSARFSVESGWVDVLPDPAAAGTKDWRSWARRTLDAVEATLEGRASTDQQAMAIGGRSISRMPIVDLLTWRDKLREEVRSEVAGSTAGGSRTIKTRLLRG